MKVVYVVTHGKDESNVVVFENEQDAKNLCSSSDSNYGFYEAAFMPK